jgi:hypothetical protein
MNEPTQFLSLGPGLAAPTAFKYRVERTDLYNLEADIVFEEGRFVIDRLTIQRREDGPLITTEGLRQIAVAALLHVAVEGNVMHASPTGEAGDKVLTWPWLLMLSERAQAGGGPSEEDLFAVATVYQVAYATGAPPTRTVMQRFGLPRSTASRWIALARERGLLGPATPRKAGGWPWPRSRSGPATAR